MQALSLPVESVGYFHFLDPQHAHGNLGRVLSYPPLINTNCSIWLVVHCNTVMKVGVTMGLVAVKTS